jgi:UDP-N-acetylmuramate--alanine ligase
MTYTPPAGSIPTLDVPSLDGLTSVHMVGIGGAGMSGIAHLLLSRGILVSGSDLKESHGLAELRRDGAVISVGHSAEHVIAPGAVVISTAIPDSNPEVRAARDRGIPVYARAQMLAALAEGRQTFAVAGTHGKTTTTSMLAVILEKCGADPTFVIGGDLNESGSGARPGGGKPFVAEADESDGSFLLLRPDVAVVTNVEEDHLDFYRGGEQEIREAFAQFIASAGHAIVCGDDPGARVSVAAAATSNVLTYGVDQGNEIVLTVSASEGLHANGSVRLPGVEAEVALSLRLPGTHNLLNAVAAIAAATFAGITPSDAAAALATFSGVRRRFEHRGRAAGAEFIDDYAHHPTEIAATLAAARRDHSDRLVAVFQPHRFTRTESLWRSLGESLNAADLVVITDVYAAGEQPIPGVTGKLLVDALAEHDPGKRIVYLPHRADVVAFLAGEVATGDLVLTLGAGDITMVADETLERMKASA